MIEAAILKAMQTVAMLTAAWLVGSCAIAVLPQLMKSRKHPGWYTTLAIFIIFSGLLSSFGYSSIQYWILQSFDIVVPPTWIRIFSGACVVGGGAIFVAQTTTNQVPPRIVFFTWSGLVAMVFVGAFLAAMAARP